MLLSVVVIESRWMGSGGGGGGLRGTATWPESVASTLPANVATGAPSASACVFWSDLLQALELWRMGGGGGGGGGD